MTIRWDFLDHVMCRMGFGIKWKMWKMTCVSLASLSFLVNGSPFKPFEMERGLRQGDPLSPYLFIMVSEAMVFLFRKAEEGGFIKPLEIGVNKIILKHLQFTDDTLLFIPLEERVMWNYMRILNVFSLIFKVKHYYMEQ